MKYNIVYVYKNGARNIVAYYTDLEEAKNDVKKNLSLLKNNSEFASIDIEKQISNGKYTTVESYNIKEEVKWK